MTKKKTGQELAKIGIRAGARAGVELAMTGDPHRSLVTFAVDLVTDTVAMAGDLLKGAQVGWWEAVIEATPGRPEEAVGKIREKLTGTPGRKVVLASIKGLMDSPDDAVIPALGKLAADYIHQDRSPDGFFRSCARMLVELTAPEYADARAVLTATDTTLDPEPATMVSIGVADRRLNFDKAPKDPVWVLPPKHNVRHHLELTYGLRVLTLLEANRLAEEASVWGGSSGRVFTVEAVTASRLSTIFKAGMPAAEPTP